MAAIDPMRIGGGRYKRQRTGLITMSTVWVVHTEEELDTFTPVAPYGLLMVDRDGEEIDAGEWKLTLTYEGLSGDGVTDLDNASADVLEVELDGSMSQDTLKSHLNWEYIGKKYGWNSTKEEFSPTMPQQTGTGTGPAKRNELYGADSYLAVGAVFRVKFATRNAPASVLAKIGEIFEIPPRYELLKLPRPDARRNWLKLAPKVGSKGRDAEVALEFMLSGPNGWNRDVYNFSQLGLAITGDSAGSGLSTGGLVTGSL